MSKQNNAHLFPVRHPRADEVRKMPVGTVVYLVWTDRMFGEMRAPYQLIGHGKMQNRINDQIIIDIRDYPFKHYEIAQKGDPPQWGGRNTDVSQSRRKKGTR